MEKALSKASLLSPGGKEQEPRECGLHALARMIAAAYRRRQLDTGEAGTVSVGSSSGHESLASAQDTPRLCIESEDPDHKVYYSETVKTTYFLRRKALRVKNSDTRLN